MSAVTQWFYCNPVNRGIYQRLNMTTGMTYFAVFDGCWFGGAAMPEEAQRCAKYGYISIRQMDQKFPWRGLAEKPA